MSRGPKHRQWRLNDDQRILVTDYMPLAWKLARQAHGKSHHEPFDDFLSDASLGLMVAARDWDSSGAAFGTYATIKIKGAIADGRRSRDPMNRQDRALIGKITAGRYKFAAQEHRFPTPDELAELIGIPADEISTALGSWQRAQFPVALEDYLMDESEGTVADLIADPRVDDEMAAVESPGLSRALGQLTPREHFVVGLYYWQDCSLQEIADVMGVTEARVSQIMSKARDRMRSLCPQLAEAA